MNEYRCKFCHKLLFKYSFGIIGDIEIVCSKCGKKQIIFYQKVQKIDKLKGDKVDCEHNYELVGKETPIA